eukprot:6194471-Pleurochrysis_carterae.AAC.1
MTALSLAEHAVRDLLREHIDALHPSDVLKIEWHMWRVLRSIPRKSLRELVLKKPLIIQKMNNQKWQLHLNFFGNCLCRMTYSSACAYTSCISFTRRLRCTNSREENIRLFHSQISVLVCPRPVASQLSNHGEIRSTRMQTVAPGGGATTTTAL